MSETVEGGIYKDAQGDGWHDATGKPVDASKVAESEKRNREYVNKFTTVTPQAHQDAVQALANTLATAMTQQTTQVPEPKQSDEKAK